MCGDSHQPPAPYSHLCIQVGMLVLKKVALLGGSLVSIVLKNRAQVML